MKQVLSVRGGAKAIRDIPAPGCAPGQLLVRNAFSVISSGTERGSADGSGSVVRRALSRPDIVRDLALQATGQGVGQAVNAVKRRLDQTWPTGYSSAGEVLEVGASVRGFAPGEMVACGGVGYANHAEIVTVPANLCARVPVGISLESAALTTIATVALHGIRLAEVRLGDRTAVIGCGLIGQIACRLLRASGGEVFALDIDADRAHAAGGDHAFAVTAASAAAVMTATDGLGVDHVLVTAASPTNDPLLLAAEIARDRAEVVVVGDVPVEMPRALLFPKELSLRISRSYGPGRYDADYERHGVDYPIGYVRWTEQRNMECVLDLQARGLLDLSDLVEEVVPVDEAPLAYERLVGPVENRPRGAIAISYPQREDETTLEAPPVAALAQRVTSVGTGAAVRIGLVGPGSFASGVIIPAFLAAGAELISVGGGAGRSADAAARGFGFRRVAPSDEAVVLDPELDAVAICTRHASHATLTLRALEAGKHVFCEKPLALNVEDLERVIAAAEASSGVLAVGFNRRFAPLVVRLRQFLALGGGPLTGTYRVCAGAIPAANWVHDLDEGGGRVLGEVCHFIDTLVFLADSPVSEVHATSYSDINGPAQAHDNVAVTLRHENGSIGTILYVARSAPGVGKERIETFSPAGIGVLDDFRTLELDGTKQEKHRERRIQKGHLQEIAAFVAAVRNGRAPVSLFDVANVSLATLAVVKSLLTGESVRIRRPDSCAAR